ncbi:MAG TPA: AsmA-like C-terminal region-containing protein [Roseiarcus sp.]|nr:AsmA-like C-terminal region-containing protein [Roseiarcus sp.]
MRHPLKWTAIGAAALLLAAAGAYRWPISSARVAAAFNRQLGTSAGVELRRPARVYLTILPLPSVQILDVEFHDKNGVTLATAPRAKARLAMAPLLFGDFQFASVMLREPTAVIDLDRGPFAKSGAFRGLFASSDETGAEPSLGDLRVEHGLLHVVSAERGVDTLIEDIDGDVDWPRLTGPVNIALHGHWRGEPLAVNAWLADPGIWMNGNRSPVHVGLSLRDATLALDGALVDGGANFEGAIAADGASLPSLTRLFGAPSLAWLPDGRASLSGVARGNFRQLAIGDARLTAFNHTFEGAITLSAKPLGVALSGSIAAETIRLDDLFAKAPSLIDQAGDWSAKPFSLALPEGLNLDLRISAATVEWRGHAIQDAAFSLMGSGAGVSATLSDALAYRGAFKGEATIAPGPDGAEIRLSASLLNADIGALAADFGLGAYSGVGGAQIALRANGNSPAALARGLSGEGSLKLGAGVIEGLSFEEALRRSERRPINLYSDMRTGRTTFNDAEAEVTIENGEARLRSATMTGPGVCVALSGTADLANRQMATELVATRADQNGAPNADGPQLKLTIAGPWSRPVIKSDSGA